MRVLHVTKKLPPLPGGDATAVSGLSRAQRRRGYEVEILAYRAPGVREDDHTHLAGPMHSAEDLDRVTMRRVRAMRALGRWARERLPRLRPDVVHAHAVDVGLPVAKVARALGIPAVLTCHGVWFPTRGRGSPAGWLERSLIHRGRYDAVTSVDGASVRALREAGFWEATLVPNGIDLTEFEGPADHDGPFRFLFVGRIVYQKGVDVLLEAAALARPRIEGGFAVDVVGDGPLLESLRQRARDLGLADAVHFRGILGRPELLQTLRTADAFMLPSRFEGFPIAILEAWAAGVPVVATAVGGIPDVCSEATALLVPPDNPARLADAMVSLARDPQRRATMTRRSRALVEERFTWDAVVDAYASVYARCASHAGRKP